MANVVRAIYRVTVGTLKLSKGSLGQNGGGTLRETKGPAPILIRFPLYRPGRDPFG